MKNYVLFSLSLSLATSSLWGQAEQHDIFSKRIDACQNPVVGECIEAFGETFLGTPYVAKTLEKNKTEELVINLEELDCTTFVENMLAMAWTSHDEDHTYEKFLSILQNLRYHDGKIDGYGSRIHYFSDWVYEAGQKGYLTDMSKTLKGIPYTKNIDFMSTHIRSYPQLIGNEKELSKIVDTEKVISRRDRYYIPVNNIEAIQSQLKNGDIVAITTSIEGLDVVHEGIIIKKDEVAYLLHASSELEKVVISDVPITDYIRKHKNQTGIMVARATIHD